VCECFYVLTVVRHHRCNIIVTSSALKALKALDCRGTSSARSTDDARVEARARAKVVSDLARAHAWYPQFASLPPGLADRKLCEYTRVLQLSTLEQRVYAKVEAEPARPKPAGPWKRAIAWLTMIGLTLYPMCVPSPPARRYPPPVARPRTRVLFCHRPPSPKTRRF
jgi:hypothetical protein